MVGDGEFLYGKKTASIFVGHVVESVGVRRVVCSAVVGVCLLYVTT